MNIPQTIEALQEAMAERARTWPQGVCDFVQAAAGDIADEFQASELPDDFHREALLEHG